MVDQIAVVQFTTPGTNGFVDITSPSITEAFKAAILVYSRETSDSANNAHGVMGVGFVAVDGAIQEDNGAFCSQLQNGRVSSTNCNSDRSSGAGAPCILAGDGISARAIEATYNSTIAGGVRLDVTVLIPGSVTKGVAILFGGLAKAAVGSATSTVSPGTHENVGDAPLFEPDVLVMVSSTGALNIATVDAAPNIGFALNIAGTPQVSGYVNFDDGASTSDSDGVTRDDSAWLNFTATSRTVVGVKNVVTFDSTGFTAVEDVTSAGGINYLALKFSGVFKAGIANLDVSSSTGDQTFSSFGFPPELVFGLSTLLTAASGTLEDGATAASAGYFVTGEKGSRAYSIHQAEGVALGNPTPTTDAHTRQEDVAALTLDSVGGIAQRATWAGVTTTGFKLNFSVATAGTLTALGIATATVLSDSEQISESVLLLTAGVDPTTTDTEQITELVLAQIGIPRTISEAEQISESLGGMILADGLDPLGPDGEVAQGVAHEGEVFALGAVEGLVGQNWAVEGETFCLGAVDADVQQQ